MKDYTPPQAGLHVVNGYVYTVEQIRKNGQPDTLGSSSMNFLKLHKFEHLMLENLCLRHQWNQTTLSSIILLSFSAQRSICSILDVRKTRCMCFSACVIHSELEKYRSRHTTMHFHEASTTDLSIHESFLRTVLLTMLCI